MRFREFLNESPAIKKGEKLFDENSESIGIYAKKKFYDIRQAEDHEKIRITAPGKKSSLVFTRRDEMVLRDHDDPEIIDVIDFKEFKTKYRPIKSSSSPDSEGFMVYRETSEYEAFQNANDEIYIYTDWGTKQRLKTGDYLVRQIGDSQKSGFVIPESEFLKAFEEV